MTDIHPALTSGRAALYLFACRQKGDERVTSNELGEIAGINPTQVRRDLASLFGRTGTRGTGYVRVELAEELYKILSKHVPLLGNLVRDSVLRAERLNEIAAYVGRTS